MMMCETFEGVRELTFDEIDMVGGAVNWTDVGGGIAAYGGATMALLAISGPIGWGLGAAYLVTCAGAGMMIGSGLAQP